MCPGTTSAIRAQLIAALEQRATTCSEKQVWRMLELRAHHENLSDEARDTDSAWPLGLRVLVDRLDGESSSERAYPNVSALDEFRRLCSTLHADGLLRQSIAHAPSDAGPPNSAALASGAIALTSELSPG